MTTERTLPKNPGDGSAAIVVRRLVKTYHSDHGKDKHPRAVDDLSLTIEHGEFFTLLGPSGCGKTTTLRSIAGLETPDSGEIELLGRPVYSSRTRRNVPVNERQIGMVFQSYAIWPHMSVFENVAFPLRVTARRHRKSRTEITDAVQRALEVVELDRFASRSATQLSGGQQQRLALARAMVARPEVVLVDEPLSNLDAKLRDTMRVELKRLQSVSGFTAVYVTHDQTEALAMSSRIAVMNAGIVQQVGAPREIYEHPANEFVASFIGRMNFLSATVAGDRDADGLQAADAGFGVLTCARSADELPVGSTTTLCVRPEGVQLLEPSTRPGTIKGGSVRSAQFLGDTTEYLIRVGDTMLTARSDAAAPFRRGDEVDLQFTPSATCLLKK